jgi:proton-coupled amino acid transporter
MADPLADYSPVATHLKTYTAGEDASRLAASAKEFGLLNMRQPRTQVRERVSRANVQLWYKAAIHSVEGSRMMSVYSSRAQAEEGLPMMLEDVVHEVDEDVAGGSIPAAVMGIIKGTVGPAVLYLPHGFASAGYALALTILAVTTFLFLYSSNCLLEAWEHEQRDTDTDQTEEASLLNKSPRRRQTLSYPELAFRALGSTGETMVKAGIALMQSGVCLTYLIFGPQNLHTSMLLLFGLDIAPEWWLIVMVGLQIPLSWIQDIRKLTPTNLLANLCILYGLITCLGFAISKATSGPSRPLVNVWDRVQDLKPVEKDWFLFIGTSVLIYEGTITLLVPLQEAVHTQEDRQKFPIVYQHVILGIIAVYTVFGLSCWMAFGADVRTVMTTSLPPGVLATTVQLAYSVAVIFTFPLQNFPALEICCLTLKSYRKNGRFCRVLFSRNVVTSIMVILLAFVAVTTMESLDKVVSLIGGLLGCPIAFFFPPLIHSALVKDLTFQRRWGNRIVAGLAIVAALLATVTTIMTW